MLKYFLFTNLTTFKLSAPQMDRRSALCLLDFLKASPTLQTVKVEIEGGTVSGSIPRDVAVVLPNVETFSLFAEDSLWQVYELAAHISCPRAKFTSFIQEKRDIAMVTGLEIFPYSASWSAIVLQYTKSPVEEVALEIGRDRYIAVPVLIKYFLTFRSSNAAVIQLGFRVTDTSARGDRLEMYREEMQIAIFSQACWTIQDHPLLPHVRCLRIEDEKPGHFGNLNLYHVIPMVDKVGNLFNSLGPLDKFTIHNFDLRILLAPFIDLPEFRYIQQVFPPVKELTISTERMFDERRCVDAIVEIAKSHYKLGKPFERVIFHTLEDFTDQVEGLKEWVSTVDCYEL